jgi:V8-like Glu-specific endopeptidase
MHIKLNKVILWVSAAFLPLVTLSSAMAYQPRVIAPQAPSLVATKVISAAEQKAALAYWDRGRVAATKPMQMPVQTGKAAIDAPAVDQPQVFGPPQSVGAGFAARDADRKARAAYPQDWAAIERAADAPAADAPTADAPNGTSQVYTSYIVNRNAAMQTMYPHRWVGRVSFTTPAGTSYCSATSISNNVMLTAAHCLYDSSANRWFSNWVFSPGYRLGSAPFGTFAATQCWVLTNWINLSGSYAINGWAQHDVGVCKMGNNSSGSTLNNAVGWMGRQWNYPYIRHFHNVGYPFRDYTDALLPSAGGYLRTCVAESFQQTTETRGMGCNHGRGISGGPWIVGYAPLTVAGAADGVNSGLFIGTQNIYAARFNSNNIVPLCNAAVC